MSLFDPYVDRVTAWDPRAADHVLKVRGLPIPQGSMTAFIAHGRAQMIPSNKAKLEPWRKKVTAAAKAYADRVGLTPYDEPMWIDVTFTMPRPKACPRWRLWASTAADADKMLRAVFDSLTGPIVTNDARFCCIAVEKRWSNDPADVGVVMRFGSLDGDERGPRSAVASVQFDPWDG